MGLHAVCCAVHRSWLAWIPPPLLRRLKKVCFLSFLSSVAFGPSQHCVVCVVPSWSMVCSMFLLDVHSRYFFAYVFLYDPPSLPHFELEASILTPPASLPLLVTLFSSLTLQTQSTPSRNVQYSQALKLKSYVYCSHPTSPRAFNIYTLLKVGNQSFFSSSAFQGPEAAADKASRPR